MPPQRIINRSARGNLLALLVVAVVVLTGQWGLAATPAANSLRVLPESILLKNSGSAQQLIVSAEIDGQTTDQTRAATYRSLTPEVVQVSPAGLVTSVADGQGKVSVEHAGLTAEVEIKVEDSSHSPIPSFELDIVPILTKQGCNMGACHGKARGQNGFALSLLGFDPEFDYESLTQNARGRRVFPAAPDKSLLLLKAIGEVPHGGGRRLEPGSQAFQTLEHWITVGAPRHREVESPLVNVTVSPDNRFVKPNEQQQLIVTAEYADGSKQDVTRLSNFSSSDDSIVAIDEHGLITAGAIPGEAATMARFMGQIATCRVAIPLEGEVPDELYEKLPRNNFIDELVWTKLKSLRIVPSPAVGDAKYMRRVYIDLIGNLPTPEEVRTFMADTSPDKRQQLVNDLLERPEYANHWANKWADLLRPNPYRVGVKAVLNYDNWIREGFRENKPYDQFARELVTARGSTWRNGATALYRDRRSPDEVTTLISQIFLGIRLECAKCHQHPFERWSQEDFYSLAAYFGRVKHRGGIGPPISPAEEKISNAPAGKGVPVKHPLTDEVLEPRPLFGEAPEYDPESDPREALADWMISEQNDYFPQVMMNRVWADLMGTGIVEPVDDLRATNPGSNEPLLKALGDEFRKQKFDLKAMLRLITSSHVYALSSATNERNKADLRNYSRHYRQRLRAEVLLDSTCAITGRPESYGYAMPPGSRASELWTYRVNSIFLDTFGRPNENQDPPCERTPDTTVTQVLHLMNSPGLHQKVTHDKGRAAKLAESDKTVDEIVEELYLLIYNRFPDEFERQVARGVFESQPTDRRGATEDLLWALLNTPEFVFKD